MICEWCDEEILPQQPKVCFEEYGELECYHIGCKAEEAESADFDNDFGCNG